MTPTKALTFEEIVLKEAKARHPYDVINLWRRWVAANSGDSRAITILNHINDLQKQEAEAMRQRIATSGGAGD